MKPTLLYTAVAALMICCAPKKQEVGFAETTNKFDASKLEGAQLVLYYLHSQNLKETIN